LAGKASAGIRIAHRDPELLLTLQTHHFRVPSFQRSYVWKDEQVQQFSSDLWESFDASSTWFIGTVIVAAGEKIGRLGATYELIDGQQRITTLFIWLAALRDECRSRDLEDLAEHIDRTYIRQVSPLAPSGDQPRLTMGNGEVDNFFQTLVVEGAPTREAFHGSEERIASAAEYLRGQISARFETSEAEARDLTERLLEWLAESLHAFIAIAPSLDSATRLFDLMNSRGLPLAPSDLLKSYLISATDGRAAPEWAAVAQSFDPVKAASRSTPDLDTFIRHQWFSRHPFPEAKQRGAPSQKATLELIRAQIGSKKSALDYLGRLRSDSDVYVQLAKPTRDYWERKSGKGVFEALQDLNLIKADVARPLLLSVTRKFSKTEQLRFVRSLVSWFVRTKAVAPKLGSGEDEERYWDAAYKVSIGTVATTAELARLLPIPEDTDFEQSFALMKVETRVARLLLGRIEDALDGSGEKETSWDQVTVEHILPTNPKNLGDWPHFTEEQHLSLRARVGNLTLLRKVKNERVANGAFALKVESYGQSSLGITSELATHADWTPEEINKRSAWLATLAVSAWPLLAPEID
jgi:hypothetical protein